jgi:hypothetical protein
MFPLPFGLVCKLVDWRRMEGSGVEEFPRVEISLNPFPSTSILHFPNKPFVGNIHLPSLRLLNIKLNRQLSLPI